MKPILVAILGALSLVVGATRPAHADSKGHTRKDDDHRYRLEITVATETAVVDDTIPTFFCLSPTREDKLEVCLGQFQGHWLFGGDRSVSTFELKSDGDDLCTCERPVVLLRDQPLCWSMTVSVADVGVTNALVGGFVTVLEDVHEVGRTAASCVNADSNRVPLTIKSKTDDMVKPPKAPAPR